jgi:hypothetical protein
MVSIAALGFLLRNSDQEICFNRTGATTLGHLLGITRPNTTGNQSSERIRGCVARAKVVKEFTVELHWNIKAVKRTLAGPSSAEDSEAEFFAHFSPVRD